MRRDVVNAMTRVRRDLRFLLADRYRALLASRFVALAAVAAGVLDRSASLAAAARRLRTGRSRVSVPGVSVVRAAVSDLDLSLIVRGAPPGADGVVLRRGGTTLALATDLDRGALLRTVSSLPVDACDGADWTLAITAEGAHHDITVADPAALATRAVHRSRGATSEPRSADWPPRLRAEDGLLTLRATAPAAGIVHSLEVGVRTAIVTWPVDPGTGTASLCLVADGDERDIAARVDGGTARATVDLGSFDDDGTWFAHAVGPAGRAVLALPRGVYPPMGATGRPHRVPLPAPGETGRAVEVGYTADNHLVVRVGNFAPAAS